jgi:hypothetical protein
MHKLPGHKTLHHEIMTATMQGEVHVHCLFLLALSGVFSLVLMLGVRAMDTSERI